MGYDIGSTHIPVLVALGLTRPIHRVLELGAGWYSTPTFLNRKVFPQLKQLVSVEDNFVWRETVSNAHRSDKRLIMTEEIPQLLTSSYDLIFVDNATDLSVRAATIRRVAEETCNVLVVIHDAEDVNYIPEIARFENHHTIKTYQKWTAIASNGRIEGPGIFASLIESYCGLLTPTDIDGWLEVLSR